MSGGMFNRQKDFRQKAVAGDALRKKGLKDSLIAFIVLFCAGGLIGRVADAFFFIIYFQLAFLVMIIVLFKAVRHDRVTLSLWTLLITAYVLKEMEIAIALGILFLVVFIGRSLLKTPLGRRLFTLSSTGLVIALSLIMTVSSPESAPSPPPSDQPLQFEVIQSLPYLSHVDDEENQITEGVVTYRRNLCAPGLNLYNSYYKAGAYLLDMSGNILHVWRPKDSPQDWHYVAACDNGDLLVCVEDAMLMRLDWDSHILWQRKMRAHHEIAIAENKDIYTLVSSEEVVTPFSLPVPIINDDIVVMSGDGTIKKTISLYPLLKDHISLRSVAKIYAQIINPRDWLWRALKQKLTHRPLLKRMTPFDIFHANTITVIDQDIEGVCQKGNLLISANNLDLIAIIDIDKEEVRWAWGPGILEGQHDPTLLKNGHILVFDNGTGREYSRILEVDPLRKDIVWEYHSLKPRPFYSSWGGAAQRFQNGNTLITETSEGRVFEITKEGKIVWKFINPDLAENKTRATIYRLTRITDAHLLATLLTNAGRQGPPHVQAID
jgi:hypothetical protein